MVCCAGVSMTPPGSYFPGGVVARDALEPKGHHGVGPLGSAVSFDLTAVGPRDVVSAPRRRGLRRTRNM